MATVAPDENIWRLRDLAYTIIGRAPSPAFWWMDDVTGDPVVEFTPPLSPAEQLVFTKLVKIVRSAVTVSPAERDALEPDIDGLRTYHGLATPTAAQTAQATKAIIRILRALLRD